MATLFNLSKDWREKLRQRKFDIQPLFAKTYIYKSKMQIQSESVLAKFLCVLK